MASIKDDRGYNQGFAPAKSTTVRLDRRTQWLLGEMTLTPATRILEIGCGTGEVSHWMAERSGATVVGTDLCVPFIEEARRTYTLPNLRFEVVDFNEASAFTDERFDYIVGNGILHHLYYGLPDALTRMRSLLAPGGKIIFMEPNLYNPYVYLIFTYPWLRKLANLEPDEMAFTKPFIRNLLRTAGFEHIRVDYKDFLLPGIPEFLIGPSIWLGDILEKLPGTKQVAQSLFIRAEHPHA
jgi:2-polyprenyl-3-methyl-5-hydroxy-6-metoxy-1,4-benzoquinol methylase